MDNFITDIHIGKVRHLENIDIKLGDTKKHLILTGKNGCGKTSVLEALNDFFLNANIDEENYIKFKKTLYPKFNTIIDNILYGFFPAKRSLNVEQPKGIKKYDIPKDKLNINFLQHIVNLKAERSFARDDNEIELIEQIDDWFNKFENMLKEIFTDDSLFLKFDRKNYNFFIHRSNREPFDFNSLSAGYSAIIDIITEIILKIELFEVKSFDYEGIVLIDEVENHLHVELQKNIMPLLTSFFPNIQFIVTTHSPFVLSSIENSVIYDLERKEFSNGDRFVNGSYSNIVKNYFEVDSEYSHILEEKISRYEELINIFEKEDITIEDEKELSKLDRELDDIALMLSTNIYLRFKELQKRIME